MRQIISPDPTMTRRIPDRIGHTTRSCWTSAVKNRRLICLACGLSRVSSDMPPNFLLFTVRTPPMVRSPSLNSRRQDVQRHGEDHVYHQHEDADEPCRPPAV